MITLAYRLLQAPVKSTINQSTNQSISQSVCATLSDRPESGSPDSNHTTRHQCTAVAGRQLESLMLLLCCSGFLSPAKGWNLFQIIKKRPECRVGQCPVCPEGSPVQSRPHEAASMWTMQEARSIDSWLSRCCSLACSLQRSCARSPPPPPTPSPAVFACGALQRYTRGIDRIHYFTSWANTETVSDTLLLHERRAGANGGQ